MLEAQEFEYVLNTIWLRAAASNLHNIRELETGATTCGQG